MKSDNKNKIGAEHASAFSKIEKIHPLKMLLYLAQIGIAILFLMLVFGFVRSELFLHQNSVTPFPRFFSVSSILILLSSYTISRVSKFYRQDELRKMNEYLSFTLMLALMFVLSQLAGWYELAKSGIYFKGQPFGSYIYLISALHILHLGAGIMYLVYVYLRTMYAAADPVRTLVYIRDPYRLLQLSMLSTYWHFLDGLWLALYFIFLFLF
ncbi:cytochrome c oxidase subunit 3 [Adhaeribacter soli]|uniref:Cytochrome c oxidase subunit III n=1 Tax=Adhaeribacter soli TaxID=2607655 RepID=A0A5N1J8Q4_9BACT|nr:cytochrome c oxidase subunit III [Adhaeribacter soli]KAA9345675.1 cytochrome c oxidase subunit III [Adhaeribacter soli]